MDWIQEFLTSGLLPGVLLALRAVTPLLALYVIWRSYTSFQKGQRRRDPLIVLRDEASGVQFPVLYWENSIGRSKSCDIYLPDGAVSRDHAVLLRREEGWFICDTGSKAGVFVNGQKVTDRALVGAGDRLTLGSVTLTLGNSDGAPPKRRRVFTGFSRRPASPRKLLFVASLVQFLMAVQGCFQDGGFAPRQFIPFLAVLVLEWSVFLVAVGALRHVSFEIETVAFLLPGMRVQLLAASDFDTAVTQLAALVLGVGTFSFLLWFMNDLDRVARFRVAIGAAALVLFAVNLVLGDERYGSKNWISLGPVSVQPSEFIKIAFVFVGTSTLDRLQTKKNITEFLIFAGACVGFLALLRDFGTALIFFACFLIIAFMRSGSVRTIALVLMAAALGVVLILKFKPYVAERFLGWGHVWEHINDSMGYQQTRVLTYMASGGWLGVGLGQGCLIDIFAADSDLVFGLLVEEQGLFLGLVVLAAMGLLIFYARSDVTRSRSTFFSIAACAAAGLLLFQTCLNVFGSTDILPMTGVTLPFFSAGGSSLVSCWGLMAFLKASDERTYAARRAAKHSGKAPSKRELEDIYS